MLVVGVVLLLAVEALGDGVYAEGLQVVLADAAAPVMLPARPLLRRDPWQLTSAQEIWQ